MHGQMNVKFVMPVYLACVCVRSITPVTTHTHTHIHTHTQGIHNKHRN